MSFDAGWLGSVVSLADANGKKRARVQMLRTGDFYHPQAPGKRLNITEGKLDEFEKNFRSGIRGKELPTNMDHDDPQFKTSPAWIVDVERSKGELFGIVEFSDDKLASDVAAGKVKYFSPEIMFGWSNPEDGKTYNCIKGAAWTNVPYIKRMQPAQLLNLSEAAVDDKNLLGLTYIKDIERALETMLGENASAADQWDAEEIVRSIECLSETPDERKVSAFVRLTEQIGKFCNVDERTPHKATTNKLLRQIMSEHGVSLAEVRLAAEDYRTGPQGPSDSFDGDPDQDGDSDQTPPQEADDYQDADAQDPNLPDQCRTCQLLSDGSCPFQGVQLKAAAAGNGNCPQYVSAMAQTTNYPGDEDDTSTQGAGAQNARFSEEDQRGHKHMPKENDELTPEQKFAALSEQVALLTKSVGEMAQENQALTTKLAESEARRLTEARDLRVAKWVDSGRVTSHQATLLGEILSLDGGNTVKLGEGDEAKDLTLSELIEQFIEAAPESTNLTEEVANGRAVDVARRPGSQTATLAEGQYPEWEKRAKEIALAEGKGSDFGPFLSRAAKEIAAEKSAGRTA